MFFESLWLTETRSLKSDVWEKCVRATNILDILYKYFTPIARRINIATHGRSVSI